MSKALQPTWVAEFIEKNHRAPRILHVGNIAGNAYQNAKLLNDAGADCDVLSADYYHVMGSPEWEDATFTGDVGNFNYPNWHKVNLHGFQRPKWYCAAPRRIAIAYLLARRRGENEKAKKLWKQMSVIYRYFTFRENSKCKGVLLALESFAFKSLDFMRSVLSKLQSRPSSSADIPQVEENTISQDPLILRIQNDAKKWFPDRPIALDKHWNTDYIKESVPLYSELFAEYDIIEAYATDGIWCYLAGISNYICFEHGTIRDFPYTDNDTTHLALLAYANSKGFMLTNTDCYDSACYLHKASGVPFVAGLHGIAAEKIAHRMEQMHIPDDFSTRFGVASDTPVFFCPSRQSCSIKGTDLVVKGAAQLAKQGYNFRLVLASWGDDIKEIRSMVDDIPELKERVIWTPPLGKEAFTLACLSVDAILDQFVLPVFGGIAFEVLATGRSVLISKKVADERMIEFYDSPMPYYPCETAEDISSAMLSVITNPSFAHQLAKKGKLWVLGCHSDNMIIQKNEELYRFCLN